MRKSNRRKIGSEDIQIEYILGSGWVHTHGMDAAGMPELEVRHVPAFLAEAAADLLNRVCDYMLRTGKRIRHGETMQTSPRTHVRFVCPEPMPENEDHYAVERLQVLDIEPDCSCCGLRPFEQN
jgi:hypothetical protein